MPIILHDPHHALGNCGSAPLQKLQEVLIIGDEQARDPVIPVVDT